MLRTFRAWLKGSRLAWIDEIPELGNRLIQAHVTLLENEPDVDAKSRGRKMAEISDTWTEQDQLDLVAFSLQYAATGDPDSEELAE